ncbi:Plasmodium exported protein (Pm-fam-a like), unknown function [Plasmodium malariae]|uniref:Fam-m protein n=1 Tax=Plasmodium malariae TaxID=5858 RepID=A0A1A8XBK4_PLAMA|nr:Plasmodium exported protein (Pm-fam-a like), unknown function [Plasmodium malariae]
MNDMHGFISSEDESFTTGRNLCKSINRLLTEYKQGECSNIVILKEDIPNYKHCEKEDQSNIKKEEIRKSEITNNSLNKELFYTQVTDCSKGMFDRKYFHFEKKWVDKNDYEVFQEQNRRTRDTDFKKIKFRSYAFVVVFFFLFFLFGIGYPILQGFGHLRNLQNNLSGILAMIMKEKTALLEPFVCSIFFGVLIIILAIIIIITIPKILINNEKYNKLKLIDTQKK